ncbi:Pro-Pol polyprotein [Dictyocoela muelleri]|nr:Pro-Pol polyprotein [Dictyocoela muelleri]
MKKIFIKDEIEKNDIITFLSSGVYNSRLSKLERRSLRRKAESFIIENGKLKLKTSDISKEFICEFEREKIERIIRENHELDHVGARGTYIRISARFDGISFSKIKDFVARCNGCQLDRPPTSVPEIRPILSSYPRERLIVDTIDMRQYSEENNQYKYIFTMIDSFSKFGWCYKALNKSSESFSKILENHFYLEGKWDILHTDNGGEFENERVKSICRQFGVKLIHGRPYHPQSQGQIERFNRTIKERLRKTLSNDDKKWTDILNRIVYFYNNNVHSATKMKPFLLFKNYDNTVFQNAIIQSSDFINTARINLIEYSQRYRREVEANMINSLNPGDIVKCLRPYNVRRCRRIGPLDSIYLESTFIVIHTFDDLVLIRDEMTGQILRKNKNELKKIN